MSGSAEDRQAAFEGSITPAELLAYSRLPLGLRIKLAVRMGLPVPSDRRGKHWAKVREARRYELRAEGGAPPGPRRLLTLEEAAGLVGVRPEYLAAKLARVRGRRREVAEGEYVVADRGP